MDAIHFLLEEHEKAKAAFAKIEGASSQHRAWLWKELQPDLKVHERIEGNCLYGPLSRDAQDRDASLAAWHQKHDKQVKEVEGLIREIDGLDPRDNGWLTKIKEVRAKLEAHIREEETEVFPRIALVWNRDRLERAGSDLEHMKGEESKRAA